MQQIFTRMFYGDDQSYDRIILKIEDLDVISMGDQSMLGRGSEETPSQMTINEEQDNLSQVDKVTQQSLINRTTNSQKLIGKENRSSNIQKLQTKRPLHSDMFKLTKSQQHL